MGRIAHFRQLDAWQEAHKLVLMVYDVTNCFPDTERYGLVSQMRRAAVSIPANIVEGFKRLGLQDKIRLYNIAEGSPEELKYFIILAQDLGYTQQDPALTAQTETTGRLLNGLIRSTKRRQ